MKNKNLLIGLCSVPLLLSISTSMTAQDLRERTYYYEILEPRHEPKPEIKGFATERVKETFSYFSLTPFGYANFAPLITATLTVAIFLLSLFSLKKKGVLKALFVLSIITVVISLLPLMYGLNYYTLVGAFITVTLVIESILAKIQQK